MNEWAQIKTKYKVTRNSTSIESDVLESLKTSSLDTIPIILYVSPKKPQKFGQNVHLN